MVMVILFLYFQLSRSGEWSKTDQRNLCEFAVLVCVCVCVCVCARARVCLCMSIPFYWLGFILVIAWGNQLTPVRVYCCALETNQKKEQKDTWKEAGQRNFQN